MKSSGATGARGAFQACLQPLCCDVAQTILIVPTSTLADAPQFTEADALELLLVEAVETQPRADRIISSRGRLRAKRVADAIGSSPRHFRDWLRSRAHALSHDIAEQSPLLCSSLQWVGFPRSLVMLGVVAGVLMGWTAGLSNGGTTLNLMAPPVLLVLLWNAVALLLTGLWRKPAAGLANALPRLLTKLRSSQADRLRAAGPGGDDVLSAYRQLLAQWVSVSAPLQQQRAQMVLHLGATVTALTVIAQMYLNGLVRGFDVAWSSTFLDAAQVHALISVVLAPATWLSGLALPGVGVIESIGHGSAEASMRSAAPWIHLWVIMLTLLVILPRTVLIIRHALHARKLSKTLSIDISTPYYRRLSRIQRAREHQIVILPLLTMPSPEHQRSLIEALRPAAPDAEQIVFDDAVIEPGSSAPGATDRQNALLILLVPISMTPETDLLMTLLTELNNNSLGALVLCDETPFRSRFRDASKRISTRTHAWQQLATRAGLSCFSIDPAAVSEMTIEAIGQAIDRALAS